WGRVGVYEVGQLLDAAGTQVDAAGLRSTGTLEREQLWLVRRDLARWQHDRRRRRAFQGAARWVGLQAVQRGLEPTGRTAVAAGAKKGTHVGERKRRAVWRRQDRGVQ